MKGAATLPAPGTEFGPCWSCRHLDCEDVRRIAASPCRYCEEPIGYSARFCRSGQRYAHAACQDKRVKSEKPDLLAALRDTRAALEKWMQYASEAGGPDREGWQWVLDKADAAIARAEPTEATR